MMKQLAALQDLAPADSVSWQGRAGLLVARVPAQCVCPRVELCSRAVPASSHSRHTAFKPWLRPLPPSRSFR